MHHDVYSIIIDNQFGDFASIGIGSGNEAYPPDPVLRPACNMIPSRARRLRTMIHCVAFITVIVWLLGKHYCYLCVKELQKKNFTLFTRVVERSLSTTLDTFSDELLFS